MHSARFQLRFRMAVIFKFVIFKVELIYVLRFYFDIEIKIYHSHKKNMYSFSFEIILNIFEIKRMTLIPKMNHSRFFIITLIDIIIKGMYNFLIRTANNLDPISFYPYHLLFFDILFKR